MNVFLDRLPALSLTFLITIVLSFKAITTVQTTLQANQIRSDVQLSLINEKTNLEKLMQENLSNKQSINKAKKAGTFFTYSNISHADTKFQNILENIIRKNGGRILSLSTKAGSVNAENERNYTKLHLTLRWNSNYHQMALILSELAVSKPSFAITRLEIRPDHRSQNLQITTEIVSFNLVGTSLEQKK